MASVGVAEVEAALQEDVASAIVAYAEEQSAALSAFTPITMGSATYRMPIVEALPTGGWVSADQGVKPSSNMSWDGVTLTPEEVALIVPIGLNAIQDANFDVTSVVTRACGQELARIVDAAVFFGTGAPASFPVGGLFGIADTANQTIEAGGSGETVVDNISDLYGIIEEVSDVDRVFAARQLRGTLRTLKDNNGVNLYNPMDGAAGVSSLYGVPLRWPMAWDAAQALAIAADSTKVAIGIRKNVEVKLATEATITGYGNLYEKNAIAVRVEARYAFAVANPVSIRTGTRVFPVAAYVPDATP